MDIKNVSEFERLTDKMIECGKLFGEFVDKTLIKIYFEALTEFEIEEVIRAIDHVKNSSTYKRIPLIGEVKQAIIGREDQRIDYAFEDSKEMVREVGSHFSVIMADKVSMMVIKMMGGLFEFAQSVQEKNTYFEFQRAYKKVLLDIKMGHEPHYPHHLHGYIESLGGVFRLVFWNRGVVKTDNIIPENWKSFLEYDKKPVQIEGAEPVKMLTGPQEEGAEDRSREIEDIVSRIVEAKKA